MQNPSQDTLQRVTQSLRHTHKDSVAGKRYIEACDLRHLDPAVMKVNLKFLFPFRL